MAKFHWTNHAEQRLKERKIPLKYIVKTISEPQHRQTSNGTIELKKQIFDRTYFVLLKQNAKGEYVIISCWANPPYPGTKDARKRKRYLAIKSAGPLRKLWLMFLDKLDR